MSRETSSSKSAPRFSLARVLAVVLTLSVTFVLLRAVQSLPDEPAGLAPAVTGNMGESGVTHPVTAVLLNFRGYDTFLEVGVLLLAALGVLVVRRENGLTSARHLQASKLHGDPVLEWLVRLLAPVLVLCGGYLLWLGTSAPGGAFQAGAVLAAGGVLLRIAGHPSIAIVRSAVLGLALLCGSIAFLLTAFATLVVRGALFDLPDAGAGPIILAIELAVTISTTFILVTLFVGVQGLPPDNSEADTNEALE